MKKILTILVASFTLSVATFAKSDKPVVYVTRTIAPESLVKLYHALGRKAEGRVAVKISTGESEKTGYLRPDFIKPLLDEAHGTIVECNTAYGGD